MKMQVYTIYDAAAVVYMRPFFAQADGQAKRSFADLVTDATHDCGKHPEDYSLVRIGRYDDQTGVLDKEDIEVLSMGLEVVAASRDVKKSNLELFDKQLTG